MNQTEDLNTIKSEITCMARYALKQGFTVPGEAFELDSLDPGRIATLYTQMVRLIEPASTSQAVDMECSELPRPAVTGRRWMIVFYLVAFLGVLGFYYSIQFSEHCEDGSNMLAYRLISIVQRSSIASSCLIQTSVPILYIDYLLENANVFLGEDNFVDNNSTEVIAISYENLINVEGLRVVLERAREPNTQEIDRARLVSSLAEANTQNHERKIFWRIDFTNDIWWLRFMKFLFTLSLAAIGASFAIIIEMQRYALRGIFDNKFWWNYVLKFSTGLLAGFLLAEVLSIPDLGAFGVGVGALIGGFSAQLVYRLLRQLIANVEGLFGEDLEARKKTLQLEYNSRLLQEVAIMKNQIILDLNETKANLTPDHLTNTVNQIDSLIRKLLGKKSDPSGIVQNNGNTTTEENGGNGV